MKVSQQLISFFVGSTLVAISFSFNAGITNAAEDQHCFDGHKNVPCPVVQPDPPIHGGSGRR